MTRVDLIILCAILLGRPAPCSAQKPGSAPSTPAISADEARSALDVLNDPAKRAAFSATLNAVIKAQPAASTLDAGGAPAGQAKPSTTATTGEGLKIPLAPDSLGAQVLLSASGFVDHLGNRAMHALDTVQSLPLLYGWIVMVATNPWPAKFWSMCRGGWHSCSQRQRRPNMASGAPCRDPFAVSKAWRHAFAPPHRRIDVTGRSRRRCRLGSRCRGQRRRWVQ